MKPSTSVLVERSSPSAYHSVLAAPTALARASGSTRQVRLLLVGNSDVGADEAPQRQPQHEIAKIVRRHGLEDIAALDPERAQPVAMDQRRARMRGRPSDQACGGVLVPAVIAVNSAKAAALSMPEAAPFRVPTSPVGAHGAPIRQAGYDAAMPSPPPEAGGGAAPAALLLYPLMSATARSTVSRNFARGGLTPWVMQLAAHRRRGAGDEEPDALPLRLGCDAADGVGRRGIQERHRGEIDHEGLAAVGDAVEHACRPSRPRRRRKRR